MTEDRQVGHVKISRKAYASNPLWLEKRTFSKWEAWEWMIQEAAWKSHKRIIGMTSIDLKRGEFVGSVRFLAEAWGWKRTKVSEFISYLKKAGQITGQRETIQGTVYLLVNYGRYQDGPRQKRTEKRTPIRTRSGQRADSERTKEKNEKKGILTTSSDFSVFEEAWAIYPRRPNNSKADARRAWQARVRSGEDQVAMLEGVRRYAEYVQVKGTEPEFVKLASTFFGPGQHWLNDFSVNGKHSIVVIDD